MNPLWFSRVQGGEHQVVAVSSTEVELEKEILYLANPHDTTFEVGQVLYVSLRYPRHYGYFACITEVDKKRIEEEAQKRHDEENRRYQELQAKQITVAREFNKRIQLPVEWAIEQKSVLSGLAENSWGDGRKRNTVDHVQVLEDLKDGRFVRHKGDFLCTGNDTGKYSDGNLPTKEEADHKKFGSSYPYKVTCKQCIKILKRKGWLNPEK